MASYKNGQAPESALGHVDGMHLAPDVAARVNAMFQYALSQGIILHVARPFGGYRTLAEQRALNASGNPTGNSASSIPLAAVGSSTHGNYTNGRVDIVGPGLYGYTKITLNWVVANAGKFGLTREFGTKDPNHFEATGSFAGGPVTTVPAQNTTKDWLDMVSANEFNTILDGKLDALQNKIISAVLRENRAQLFRNQDTGEEIGIFWQRVPNPAAVLYFEGPGQITSHIQNYEDIAVIVTPNGIIPEPAKDLPDAFFKTLLKLATGTDSAYTRKRK